MIRLHSAFLFILGLGAALACGRDASGKRAEPTVATLDSAIPREEALRRFREHLPPIDSLAEGAGSPDTLAARFVRALGDRDTAVLRQLILSRAEFAYLFYPSSAQGKPPYDLSPQLMWAMHIDQSESGITTLLGRLGGRRLELLAWSCGDSAIVEGANRILGPCRMRVVMEGRDTVEDRLTGPILERGGRYKFVSYTNELD